MSQRVAGDSAFAPELLDAEVFAVLTRRRKRAAISTDRYREGLEVLVTAPVERVSNRRLIHDAAALTSALSEYDALYAALARRLGCPLLTADARLAATAAEQVGLVVVHVPR